MQQLPKFTPHPRIAPRKSVYMADMDGCDPDNPPWDTYYAHDYLAIFQQMANYPAPEREQYCKSVIRKLVMTDLFFIVYFIMDVPPANEVFPVTACNELEASTPDGGLSMTRTLQIWAREHFKSVSMSIGLTIKRIMNNPDCTNAIFSYKKPAADKFLVSIRETLEKEMMIACFPDILYNNPDTESPSWSLQHGIRVKRKSVSRKENTVEAFGLIEGMPTGGHYDHRMYDDVETFDIAKSPDQMDLCFHAFEMSDNLGTNTGTENIVGTYYSHIGPLVRIRDKKDIHGESMYKTVIKPATHDGTRTGRPVLLSQERLEKLMTSKFFDAQQLCQPTPTDIVALDSRLLQSIDPAFLPKDRYKFLIIDQAGGKDTQAKGARKGDMWSIGLISVKPQLDDIGSSNCYLEEFEADQMTHAEAIDTIIRMYLDGGFIRAIGVEKVGLSTTEIHIRDALKVHGRRISEETKTLILLRPAGRNTEERVEAALQWPLCNRKLFISTAINAEKRQKLTSEMDLFPFYHPDIINMWAYAYDIIKTYRFTSSGDKPRVSVTNMMAARRVDR
jgi:hypothetical protein